MTSCSRCSEPAVASLAYMGQDLCRGHFVRFFEERAKKELAKQGRLPAGIVAVALSGGKDSVSLLHFLHAIVADRHDVRLVAVTVDEGIAGYRESALEICRDVTDRLGIEWRLVRTRDLAGYDIDDYASGRAGPSGESAQRLRIAEPLGQGPPGLGPDDRPPAAAARPACGPCGVFRRAGLNQVAREIGASAVVTGHNLDDMAQTVLMNVLGGDAARLGRIAPHMPLADGDDSADGEGATGRRPDGLVPRLVPFRTLPEKEVLLYALLQGLPIHDEAECPYAARAQRFALRDQLWQMEARAPGTRHRLIRFADTVKPLLQAAAGRGDAAGGDTIATCPECGEPTSARDGTACRVCDWKA